MADGAEGVQVEGEAGTESLTRLQRVGLAKVRSSVDWLRGKLGLDPEGLVARSDEEAGGMSDDLVGNIPKTVIFAHHKHVMDGWHEHLNVIGKAVEETCGIRVKAVRIDGSTDSKDRFDACQLFNHTIDHRFALVSVTAGGVGLNLSQASIVVFAELPSEAGLVQQAEARAHRRGGQSQGVQVCFLVAERTVDEGNWNKLMRSLCNLRQVHDGVETVREDLVHAFEHTGQGRGGATRGTLGGAEEHQGTQERVIVMTDDEEDPSSGTAVETVEDEVVVVSGGGRAVCGTGAAVTATEEREAAASPRHGASDQVAGRDTDHGDIALSPDTNDLASFLKRRGETLTCSGRKQKQVRRSVTGQVSGQEQASVFFEVSPFSGRIHIHGEEDGSRPLGISVPICGASMLLREGPREVFEVLRAQSDAAKDLGLQYGVGAESAVKGMELTVALAIAEAAGRFAREWFELSSMQRHRLIGHVLSPDVGSSLLSLDSAAEGAYLIPGGSRERTGMTAAARHHNVPEGAVVFIVQVETSRGGVTGCMQGVTLDDGQSLGHRIGGTEAVTPSDVLGTRLCVMCWTPCGVYQEGAKPIKFASLFCAPGCYERYVAACTTGGLRRQLAKIERGVCTVCKLDCRELCMALQVIRKGPQGWKERREETLRRMAPSFFGKGASKKTRERLLVTAQEGWAWQADHVIPVHLGGGECSVENMRTLCSVCHAKVTKEQAAARAKERQRAKVFEDGAQRSILAFVQPTQQSSPDWGTQDDVPSVSQRWKR